VRGQNTGVVQRGVTPRRIVDGEPTRCPLAWRTYVGAIHAAGPKCSPALWRTRQTPRCRRAMRRDRNHVKFAVIAGLNGVKSRVRFRGAAWRLRLTELPEIEIKDAVPRALA
jgi:hypothetical protein